MRTIYGVVHDVDPASGIITCVAPFDDGADFVRKGYEKCEIRLIDGRSISPEQRRKIFALVADIADYVTDVRGSKRRSEEQEILRQLQLLYVIDAADREAVRRQLTQRFCSLLDVDLFSLSDVTNIRDQSHF